MSLWLDSRPLHGRRQGGSEERLPQGRLMRTLGGIPARRRDEDRAVDQKQLE